MAKVYGNNAHNGNAQLKREYDEKASAAKRRMRIGIVISVTGFILYVQSMYLYGNMFVLGIPMFLLGNIIAVFSSMKYEKYKGKADALNIGIQGEEVITSTLTSLPDDYMIFNNVALNYNGELTEIDSIILSCHGIFVVDVKNYKGVLFGLESDDVWSRTKISKADKSYGGAIKNPVKQVDRKAQIVSNVLYKKGIRTDVEGYVVLPMADKVIVDSDKVFLNIIQLKQTILSKNQAVLSQDKVETIKDILMQL